jgi:hypothetical protein
MLTLAAVMAYAVMEAPVALLYLVLVYAINPLLG